MSLKILTSEYMFSDVSGMGPNYTWFPRVVSEAFLGSTKDGEISVSPDPVTMISGDITWYNDSDDPQHIWVMVHRAPRSIVAQSPVSVVLHDAWSWRIGPSPSADYPSVVEDTFGGRMAIDRASVSADNLQYGRYFLDGDDTQTYVDVGEVPPAQAFHFRYLCAVQTPGVWTESTNFTNRWEADARWARLVALAFPVDVSVVTPPIATKDIYSPEMRAYPSSGTYTAPYWQVDGDTLTFALVGGGGGGEGEIGVNMGQGGLAGRWNGVLLTCGIDYYPETDPRGATLFTVVPGAAGAGIQGYFGNGYPGGASTVTWRDPSNVARSVSAAGGAGGSPGLFNYGGGSPGNYNFPAGSDNVYIGGAGGVPGLNGGFPGGGGGGAIIFQPWSGWGAAGVVFAKAFQS